MILNHIHFYKWLITFIVVFPWSSATLTHHYGNAAVQSFMYDIMSLPETMSEVSIITIYMQKTADISELAFPRLTWESFSHFSTVFSSGCKLPWKSLQMKRMEAIIHACYLHHFCGFSSL